MYITIKAKPTGLFSNIKFIKLYLNKDSISIGNPDILILTNTIDNIIDYN